MSVSMDLTGQRFGRLVATKKTDKKDKYGYIYYECRCDCGNIKLVLGASLKKGNTKSCGCLAHWKAQSLAGQRFGRLIVIKLTEETDKYGKKYYECICDCGNIKLILGSELKSSTKSCGCLKAEREAELTGQRFGRLVATKIADKGGKNKQKYYECKCDCGNTKIIIASSLKTGATISCGCYRTEISKNFNEKLNLFDGTNIDIITSKKIYKNNKTGAKGVHYSKKDNKYYARISFKGTKYSLGSFSKLEDAKVARKLAEDRIYGEFLEWYYENYPSEKNRKYE